MIETTSPAPPLGFTFRETMGGYIATGLSDFAAAAALGRDRGETLRFRVRITIPDLAAFLDDPTHQARLTGTVEGRRFGGRAPIEPGVFNLFRADDRGRKQMCYRFSFRDTAGQRYRLEGYKDVHNGRIIDVWSDTTTLFTTVRREDGGDEPVVATGILRIRALDLVPQVASMRGLHAGNASDGARALALFGRFFFSQLWNEYAPALPGSRATRSRVRAVERGEKSADGHS